MHFIVIGRDGDDPDAIIRRRAARASHLALGDRMQDEGTLIFGVALLDDLGQMSGSVLLVDFPSRRELDEWLKLEPYVVGDVWREVNVEQAQVGPGFLHLL